MYTRRRFLAGAAATAAALTLPGCRNGAQDGTAAPASGASASPDPDASASAPIARAGMRPLGRSGIGIAPFVLGANVFGWTADRERSFELLDRFVDGGYQAVDTADVYSAWAEGNRGGESETIIGDWMASRGNRDAVVVITKGGGEMPDGRGLSPAWIERAVDDSLRRLRTDRIDLYFSHFPDDDVPHAETLGAYQRLIEAGKLRAIGASNFSPEQTRAALDAAAAGGLPRYEVLQPRYNLYDRGDFEGPLRDLAIAEELGVITYSSLASGFLSGKYRSEEDLSQSQRGRGIAKYLDARGQRILAALDDVAARHRAEPAEVALAWIVVSEGVTAPISSATSVEQLDSLLRAPELAQALTVEDKAQLDEAGAA